MAKARYYANDKEVLLEEDPDLVAINTTADAFKKLPAAVTNRISAAGDDLRRGVVLVGSRIIDEDTHAVLAGADALYPVYRHRRGRVVILPEIRAEDSDPKRLKEIADFLERELGIGSVEAQGGRLVVRAPSGSKTLELANEVRERFRPELVQPRTIQVIPRRNRR